MFRTVTVTRWGESEPFPDSGVTAIQGISSESQLISPVQSRFARMESCRVVSSLSTMHEAFLVSASKVRSGPETLIDGSRMSASSCRQPERTVAARVRNVRKRVLDFIFRIIGYSVFPLRE